MSEERENKSKVFIQLEKQREKRLNKNEQNHGDLWDTAQKSVCLSVYLSVYESLKERREWMRQRYYLEKTMAKNLV